MATIRRPGAASAAVLIGLTVSLAAAHLLAPEWSRRAGLDVWNYAALDELKKSIAEERAEMDAKAESDVRRRARADQLATRLVTGEAPLEVVAAEIGALFAGDEGWKCALEAFHAETHGMPLLHARHAIDRATRLLNHDPARKDALRVRLETEYRVMETRHTTTAAQ